MISANYITEWAAEHPWCASEQVEQDLLIARALVAIFSDPFLKERLAFRGGTALHKLYFSPQARYSEDIDLVQIAPAPFGPIFDHLKRALDFLPNMKRVQKTFNNSLRFKAESSIPPIVPIKIKVETNCKEHFTELGHVELPFAVENGWFAGACQITTFHLEELLGTKLRALYQRKKGRDYVPSRGMFEENMAIKLAMPEFMDDTMNYLDQAYHLIPRRVGNLSGRNSFEAKRNPVHELELSGAVSGRAAVVRRKNKGSPAKTHKKESWIICLSLLHTIRN